MVLPSLQILTCETPLHQTSCLHSLALFSSPTVHTLELVNSNSSIVLLDPPGSPHHILTGAIAQAFPSLLCLDLTLMEPPPEDVSDFITGLTVLKQLREIKLQWPGCSLDPHRLRELVFGLPHLVGLDASIDGFSDVRRGQLDRIFAPSLRRLKCSGAWDDIVRLPFALKCPALDELRLSLHRPSPSMFLKALCQCVRGICGQAFAPRLRLLSIFATGAAQVPERRSIAGILAPLAALESLEDLTVEIVDRGESMLLVPLGSDDIMRTVAAALRRAWRVSLVVRHAQSHTMHNR